MVRRAVRYEHPEAVAGGLKVDGALQKSQEQSQSKTIGSGDLLL